MFSSPNLYNLFLLICILILSSFYSYLIFLVYSVLLLIRASYYRYHLIIYFSYYPHFSLSFIHILLFSSFPLIRITCSLFLLSSYHP